MVRLIGALAGIVFVVALVIAALMPREASPEDATHLFHKHPKELHLASDGPFGKFDRQQLQRGFQVYKEVCSACHSIDRTSGVTGTRVSVRVDIGGRRLIKKKKHN